MKLDTRTAGALTALGGLIFLLSTFGLSRVENLLIGVAPFELPRMGLDCCGCFGIGAFGVPLALLALTLFRKPPEQTPPQ